MTMTPSTNSCKTFLLLNKKTGIQCGDSTSEMTSRHLTMTTPFEFGFLTTSLAVK